MATIKRASVPIIDVALYKKFRKWAKGSGMTLGAALAKAFREAMEAKA